MSGVKNMNRLNQSEPATVSVVSCPVAFKGSFSSIMYTIDQQQQGYCMIHVPESPTLTLLPKDFKVNFSPMNKIEQQEQIYCMIPPSTTLTILPITSLHIGVTENAMLYRRETDISLSLHDRRPCDNEVNIVKRTDEFVIETIGDDNTEALPIKNLKPHEKSDPFNKNKNLIGAVYYARGGKPVEKDTAFFAFKDPLDLECHAGICKPDTQHARLHREMYGKCPEEEKDLVATGLAFKLGHILFFSGTLNDKSKPYLDKKRYKNENREAGDVEKEMITKCIDKWHEDNCPMDWTYSPQKMEISKE